jgi:hypothetical protein
LPHVLVILASTRQGRFGDEEGNLKDSGFYGAAATRLLDDPVWWAQALQIARS